MSSSHQFAIMSQYSGQKNYHEVCANYLSHSAISSIDSGWEHRVTEDKNQQIVFAADPWCKQHKPGISVTTNSVADSCELVKAERL